MTEFDFMPSRVRFEYTPDLYGCRGYFANTIPELRRAVSEADSAVFGTLVEPRDSCDMMLGCRELGQRFLFFYPDWMHGVYQDCRAGQPYLFRRSPSDEWERLPGDLPFDSELWSRDFQYQPDLNCSWGRLLEWLASGYGLVRGVLKDGRRVVSFTATVLDSDLDKPVPGSVQVRPFGGDDWVSPTVSLMDDFLFR